MRPTPLGDIDAQEDKSITANNGSNALFNIPQAPFMG